MRILIPGISGGIARQVARALLAAGHEVIGVDARPWPDAPHEIELHNVDIRKRAAEDAERSVQRHEARVTELEAQLADPDLYDGSAEKARTAAALDQELAAARRALDAAMAAWAEVSDAR